MSSEQKAKELIEKCKWINYDLDDIEGHKEAALIAVDEILTVNNKNDGYINCDKAYWQEVKNHLNNM